MKVAISSVDLQTAVGKRIAQLRKERGMRQFDLSCELDVTTKHLSECERGVAMFSIERLLDICEIFDVSLDYLIRGIPTDDGQLNFPPTMVEVFRSGDKQEISLLTEYLNMYAKLRDQDTSPESPAAKFKKRISEKK
jgi:transcriptional regulator with XRE-family HTH domain